MDLNENKINRIRKGEIKDLRYADLRDVDLRYADLSGADLSCANLTNADLRYADLSCANLRYVDLSDADLRGTNLRYADLRNANLRRAVLMNVKTNYLTIGYNIACPEKGEFIGYKKAKNCLIELLILEDSKRNSATTAKCRCDKAKVLEITDIITGEKINKVRSNFNEDFIYTVGEIIKVDDFDEDRWNECSTGIHFFMNKENAINY